MSRKACQGDVFRFIVNKIPGVKNADIKNLHEEIAGDKTYDSRISEIIRLKRNGYSVFSNKEEYFYNAFFKDQDLDVVYDDLRKFLMDEDLVISYEAFSEDISKENYILRFLRFGLANTKRPKQSSEKYIDHPSQIENNQEDSDLTSEEQVVSNEPSVNGKETSPASNQEDSASSSSSSLIEIYEQNRKTIIILVTSALFIAIILSFIGIGLNEFFLRFLLLPRYIFIPLAILLAVSPKAIGFIDAYIRYYKYRKHTEDAVSFKTFAKYGNRNGLDEGEGVFDAGTTNLIYGLISNLTGAFIYITLYLYASHLEGLTNFIKSQPNNLLMFIVAYGIFLIFSWNIKMQKRPMPEITDGVAENPKIYQLNRIHVLLTILHLSFSVLIGAYVVFNIFGYGFNNPDTHIELNPWFILVIFTSSVYLWYASKSPRAQLLKVDCGWLIHLIPVMAVATTFYILKFCFISPVALFCLFENVISIWLWRCAVNDNYTFFPDFIKKTEQTE